MAETLTVRQRLIKACVVNGMCEKQATEVVNGMIESAVLFRDPERKAVTLEDSVFQAMSEVIFDDSEETYPKPLLECLWINTKEAAVTWIDKNCPKAFYRPMFADDPEASRPPLPLPRKGEVVCFGDVERMKRVDLT